MTDGISLGMPLFHKIMEGALVFLLRDVARYRIQVIRNNLESAFVYKSDPTLRSDIDQNYRFLAKILRQVVFKASLRKLDKKLNIKPLPDLDHWLEEGKSVIITMGHVSNWEWAGLYLGMKYRGHVCALYKRIKMKWVNDWMIRRRKLLDGYLIESGKMADLIRLIKSKPVMVLMIADQNPGHERGIIWTTFFKRNTAFANGPEALSVKYQLPVLYLHQTSLENGNYQLEFKIITDGKSNLPEGEIIKRYAKLLEDNIESQRSEWLWSHKRWKRSLN
jgi:Kdo2-lipid IVA lauroyltransferase/acyltransferase